MHKQIYQLNTKQNTFPLVSKPVLKAKYLIFRLLSYKSEIKNKTKPSCTARITLQQQKYASGQIQLKNVNKLTKERSVL